MTKAELSRLYYLNKEIQREEERICELEAASTSCTTKISGLPHMGGIADKTGIAAGIADCRTAIEKNKELCIVEYNRLMRYINSIDDSLIRLIFKYRYLDCLKWDFIAARIGGDNSAESLRQIHKRFLDKQKDVTNVTKV